MKIIKPELADFLNEKAAQYENPEFLDTDPIQIPAQFSIKQDIEISGFLVATIAWGNRKSIINNGKKLMDIMGNTPYDFILNYQTSDIEDLQFVHRTFNVEDLSYFFKALKYFYTEYHSLEDFFKNHIYDKSMQRAIHEFKKEFFSLPHPSRTTKHISDPLKNSAAKRINMFFRWMVRSNTQGVDFGIWNEIPTSVLSCPLDVHSGNVARKLGLLKRKQNDAKALLELDTSLRMLDVDDPVKYDFALFGLGVFEKF